MQYIIKNEITGNNAIRLPIGAPTDKWTRTTVYYQHADTAPAPLFTYNREIPEQTHRINYSRAAVPDGSYVARITCARTWLENGNVMARFTCETTRADEFPQKPCVAHPADLRLSEYETAALEAVPDIYTLYIDSYNKRRYFVEVTKETMSLVCDLSAVEPFDYEPLVRLFRDIYNTGDPIKIRDAPFLRRAVRYTGSHIQYEGADYYAIRIITLSDALSVTSQTIIHGALLNSIRTHALLEQPKAAFIWFPNGD
jgi:hypothetical protein